MKKLITILFVSLSIGVFAQDKTLLGLNTSGMPGKKFYSTKLYYAPPFFLPNDSTVAMDTLYMWQLRRFFELSGRLNYVPTILTNIGFNKSHVMDFNAAHFLTQQDSVWNGSAYILGKGTGIGTGAIEFNSGFFATGAGLNAARQNTADYVSAFGGVAGEVNTGFRSSFMGYAAGHSNTGNDATFNGFFSGYFNTGLYPTGFGSYALYGNTGDYNSANGAFSQQFSHGSSNASIAYASGQYNVGTGNVMIGFNNMTYNNWNFRTSIGYAAGNDSFLVASSKSFASANVVDSFVIITAHGFGTVGNYINLRFLNVSGTNPGGLTTGGKYQFRIRSADTLVYSSITSAGSGSFTLNKDVDQTASTAIGYRAWNSRDHQVVLGNDAVNLEVRAYGNMKMDSMQLTAGAGASKVLTSDANGRGTWQTPATGLTLANPTGNVNLIGANGSASTAMRSDASLILDQTITPTMTGKWIFQKTTNPVQIGYDANNYMTITPSSLATTTFDLTASSGVPAFIFNKNILIGSGFTPTIKLTIDGAAGTEAQRFTFTSDRTFYHSIIPSYSATASADYLSFKINTGTASTQTEVLRLIGNNTVSMPGLNSTGIVHNSSAGLLSTSLVSLTADVTGTLPVANGGTGITLLGTGISTFWGTPSSANLAAALTDETGSGAAVFGTAPTLSNPVVGTQSAGDNSTKAASTAYVDAADALKQSTGLSWLLASGGTLTGTNTITAGSNPLIISTGVTTGTGATAGLQVAANSLTTGNGLDISSSSLTSGNLVKIASTGTAATGNFQTALLDTTYGANATSAMTTYAGRFWNTHTGTTSTNVGLVAGASGGTTNYAALFPSGNVGIGTSTPTSLLSVGANTFQVNSSGNVGVYNSSVVSTTGLHLDDATHGINRGFDIQITGTSASNYGVLSIAQGAGTTNYGIYGSATNATTNWGLYVAAGNGYFNDKVGIGQASPAASSVLDIVSTTKGVLLPRMTKTQRDAISSPAQGLVVFVTDNGGYLSWYNSGWQKITSTAD